MLLSSQTNRKWSEREKKSHNNKNKTFLVVQVLLLHMPCLGSFLFFQLFLFYPVCSHVPFLLVFDYHHGICELGDSEILIVLTSEATAIRPSDSHELFVCTFSFYLFPLFSRSAPCYDNLRRHTISRTRPASGCHAPAMRKATEAPSGTS